MNKTLFGFECMGCGIQRSALMIFRGQFVDAFLMYPAIYPLLLLVATAIYNHFINFKYSNIVIVALAILTVLLMVGNYILKFI